MTAEEFVKNCYKEKEEMLKIYFNEEKETQVGNQIKNIVSKGISNDEIKGLVNSVMNEVFYTILMGLDGEASIGNSQMSYKLYDEENKLLEDLGDYAYEEFIEDNK